MGVGNFIRRTTEAVETAHDTVSTAAVLSVAALMVAAVALIIAVRKQA